MRLKAFIDQNLQLIAVLLLEARSSASGGSSNSSLEISFASPLDAVVVTTRADDDSLSSSCGMDAADPTAQELGSMVSACAEEGLLQARP